MQLPYLEALKDLPGYTPILKAVLKSQIQMLVEQLSEQTGEESVVITASVDDGTLCHLGSDRGRNFLDGREELKSQFLTHCISADDASQFPVVPDDTPRPVKIGRYGTRSLTSTNMSRRQKSKNIVPDQKQSSQHTRKIPLPTTRRKSATVSSEFHNTSSSSITSANTVSNVPDTDNSDIAFKYDLPSDNLTNNQVVSDSMIETVIDGDEGNLIQSQASLQTLAQEDKSVDNSSVQLLNSSQIKTEFIKSEEPDLEVTEVELGGDSNWNTGMVHNSSASELQIGTETESNQSGTDTRSTSLYFQSQAEYQPPSSRAQITETENIAMTLSPLTGDQTSVAKGKFNLQRYLCQYCKKTFLSKYNYKRHQLIHTGERPFTCEVCEQCFRQKVHLKRHAMKYHNTGLVPCDQDSTVISLD